VGSELGEQQERERERSGSGAREAARV
jgi:hypothetical protein